MLAGPSAADSYGLWHGFDTRLHVSVGENSSRLRTNVAPSFRKLGQRLSPDTSNRSTVVHWLVDGAVPELGPECWRVPLPVCLRQMVEWCDRETAIACLDTALTEYRLSRTRAARDLLGCTGIRSPAGREVLPWKRLRTRIAGAATAHARSASRCGSKSRSAASAVSTWGLSAPASSLKSTAEDTTAVTRRSSMTAGALPNRGAWLHRDPPQLRAGDDRLGLVSADDLRC